MILALLLIIESTNSYVLPKIKSSDGFIYSHTHTYAKKNTRLYQTFQDFLKSIAFFGSEDSSPKGKNYGLSARIKKGSNKKSVVKPYVAPKSVSLAKVIIVIYTILLIMISNKFIGNCRS